MKKIYSFLLFFILCKANVYAQLAVSATQVAGTCVSDAQINVVGSGGTSPYQFRLTAGASGTTYPTSYQSGTNFSGLGAGNYTVQVKDAVNGLATKNVTVATSYVSLAISSVSNTSNTCPLSPNGTVTIIAANGKAPLSYALLQGAVLKYGPQAINTFTGITNGSYTAQVTDACGEIRTFSTTVTLNDYKWVDVKLLDNNFITGQGASGGVRNAPTPFDTTKLSNIHDGPLLFTCDSIAFRILNTLSASAGNSNAVLRRIYIERLIDGAIIWDNTFKPSDFPGSNSSPSVHLKINEDYRFHFDDLCNDVDFADRNFNYNNSDNYSILSAPVKTCTGFIMNINHPSDWDTKNQYNSPVDVISIISSSVPGDPVVGSTATQNLVDWTSSQPLSIAGITVGATYTVQFQTLCSTYTKTVTITSPTATSVHNPVIADQACKLNTAEASFNIIALPLTAGPVSYSITSGPASFTDAHGNVYPITYPINDSYTTTGISSDVNININIRNLPQGTYTINFTNQCAVAIGSKTFTITSADVAQITGAVVVNQQCPGASSITFNGAYQHVAGQLIFQKQNGGGTYGTIPGGTGILANTVGFVPSYTVSALSDGNYRVVWLPITSVNYQAGAVTDCDTFFIHYDTLAYKQPALDTAKGYVCTPGGSDGKITLFPDLTKGIRPFQYQMIDVAGNPLSAYQPDSTFTGLSKGLYNFRIKDACGNATIFSYQIDTLKNAGITPSTTCPAPGTPFTLAADSIYNATYSWSFTPTASSTGTVISTSRILNIDPLTPADYGTYTLTYSIPGCSTLKSTKVKIGNCVYILPISLSSFNALIFNCKTELKWQSATETALTDYAIEYSNDGNHFSTVGVVNAKGSNSSYSYQHQSAPGKAFYRLRMADIDGRITYSKILYLNINCNGNSIITVYPNPVKDKVTITGLSQQSAIRLITVIGQELTRVTTLNTTYELDMSKYPSGTYLLQVTQNDGTTQTIKLNKEY